MTVRASAAGVSVAAVAVLVATAVGESAASVPSTTAAAVPTVANTDQPGQPIDVGLAPLELRQPSTSGAGDRPTFSWAAVSGASSYLLAIVTGEGEPVWAWQGAATAVVLGGWDQPPAPEAPGPLISGPCQWFVVALDSAGLPLATSVLRPITP